MGTSYDQDVAAWAGEQATLLRAGKFSALDVEHIAEEIEDVGKGEQRELANRMAVLLARLLQWQFQPDRRGSSWRTMLRLQRSAIGRRLRKSPSLSPMLVDPDWIVDIWDDARQQAAAEMNVGLLVLPDTCPWSMGEVLDAGFFPDSTLE
jgi:hypothetical protein